MGAHTQAKKQQEAAFVPEIEEEEEEGLPCTAPEQPGQIRQPQEQGQGHIAPIGQAAGMQSIAGDSAPHGETRAASAAASEDTAAAAPVLPKRVSLMPSTLHFTCRYCWRSLFCTDLQHCLL